MNKDDLICDLQEVGFTDINYTCDRNDPFVYGDALSSAPDVAVNFYYTPIGGFHFCYVFSQQHFYRKSHGHGWNRIEHMDIPSMIALYK